MAEITNRQFDDFYDEEYIEQLNFSEDSSVSYEPNKSTPQYHIQQAEVALQNLKYIIKESGWKKILQHKSGISVSSKPGVTSDKLPIFMGEHIIEGFSPQSVFAVIGMRKLWDDWYEEGNLVENLDETTSLTYMVMQALAGSKTRDLSLVEKIECSQNGTIYFVSTSVETPRVPRVANRIRAHIVLNGWVLEPVTHNPPRTKATYVLQIKIKGWVPSVLSKTYLARRPLVLYTIDQYLQKNGSPPMVISSGTPPESVRSDSSINQSGSLKSNDFKSPKKKISFTYLNEANSSPSTTPGSPTVPIFPIVPNFPSAPASPPSSVRETQNNLFFQDVPKSIKKFSSVRSIPAKLTSTTMDTMMNTTINTTMNTTMNTRNGSFRPKCSAKPIRHRHTESVKKAFETFKSHLPMDNWNISSEDNGLKIYVKEFPGKSTPIMRGDGVISGGFTIYDILSLIKNLDMRKLWDDRYDEGAVYEIFSLHERLARTAMKGTFPISGRDISVCEMLDCDENTGTLYFITTSVSDHLIPESKKLVRANLDFAGWKLEPNFDSNGNTTSVNITYIVDVDVKLDTIPSSIRKTLSLQIPMIVSKLDEVIQKMGYPPYVLNSTTKIIKEGFNIKNNQYDLSLIAEGSSVTEFKISKLMYPNGIHVSTIPENCKIGRLSESSESSETIRVILPSRVDLDNLMITISKHSKGFKMTYNNEQIIPLVSDSDWDEKHAKNIMRSTNATPVVNGTVNGRLRSNASDSQMYKKFSTSASRSVIPPKDFVKPSEVSLKNDSYQRVFDKQTLLENKIAAVTRASPEVQNVSTTTSEVIPKIEESVMEKLKNEIVENTGDLEIIKDSFRFNSRQIGLIFASMLFAYYAGKLST
uniref:StAR-related lipid transfer protein 5 n=1 Tax=Anthurium amnicola TaxID=1678845 RepID=A0A1D1ZJI2_9ARAE